VTKGGFYWHFDGRQALLGEILDAWERLMVDEAVERVEEEGGDARERLRRLFALASSERIRELVKVDLAVRDWARRDPKVARRLRRVDNRRMEYMRTLLRDFVPNEREVEARCLIGFSLFIGSPFVAADHGALSRAEVMQVALERLLEV
jgi:AcrR family transcriptional regulator